MDSDDTEMYVDDMGPYTECVLPNLSKNVAASSLQIKSMESSWVGGGARIHTKCFVFRKREKVLANFLNE
jgi:hypothetical protein